MVRTFQITKALAKMPVIDNMMLAAPDQPGEHLYNLVVRPGAARGREREVRRRAEELLEVFQISTSSRTSTRQCSRAGSASCWSSRAP